MSRSNASAPGGKAPALLRHKSQSAEQNAADAALRETGIRVMGGAPWGTHICIFYETKEDLIETAAAYFEAGLRGNEFCYGRSRTRSPRRMQSMHCASPFPISTDIWRPDRSSCCRVPNGISKEINSICRELTGGWNEKLRGALAKGYDGMRVSGNAFWIATNHWKAFCEYEQELDRSLAGQKMIVLCTYSLQASRAVDVLDVARAHQCSTARRNGQWEFLETPDLRQAKEEIKKLNRALDILSKPFVGRDSLTPRERVALAQIVRGASSKEAARTLGISPRTVEFHRANVMQKLGAKNSADLVRRVLGE